MSATRPVVGAFILLTAIATSTEAQPAAADEIQVVRTEPIHAIVLPMKGSYMQHQEAFERLGSFLAARAVTPTSSPFGRYFSDPSVGEANLEWEVGFPVPDDATVEAPFELRDVPGALAAVHLHRGGYESLGPAWSELVQWVVANGYQPTGPAFQGFGGDLSAPVVEMRMPVQE